MTRWTYRTGSVEEREHLDQEAGDHGQDERDGANDEWGDVNEVVWAS